MKKVLLFLSLVSLAGCRQDAPLDRVLDFGTFTFRVPDGWQAFPRQGIDSQVGGLTNGRDTLRYDYGWYSYRLQNETSATHERTTLTLDGRPALLVRPKQQGRGTAGVFVEVGGPTRFVLTGRDLRNEDLAVRIMKSVDFD